MRERADRRTHLELTQTEAARRAGVSLATWRRWEEHPASVSAKTVRACERVLEPASDFERALSKSAAAFAAAWAESPRLTPRQAYAIALELDGWADMDIAEWLREPSAPLHEVAPFSEFDLRVMMLVGENRAWADAVRQRCRVISEEIEAGTLPFDRSGPLIDEVLIGAALSGAQASLEDMPEIFDRIAPRGPVNDEETEEHSIGDDDWDAVSDGFDDGCRWDEWEVPLRHNHPLLPAILAERHPYRWFDEVGPSGAGYLQRLSGIVTDD
ncbi:MAG: family transcriptional regulator [Glaciihabitans sp.]|nr:family transcriptional regulator [Glaciihabitans sp.]